jgi:antitoxin CcdA
MELQLYDRAARKKATNVSVNADLLRQAKALNVNLSQTLERCLEQVLLEEKRRAWKEENHQAIDEYNSYVKAHGTFGDRHRRF